MKEIKLNFKFNERTANGRIYSTRNMLKFVSKRIMNRTFFLEYSASYDELTVDLKKIIGYVVGYRIKKDQLYFYVEPLNEKDNKILNIIDECTIGASGLVNKTNGRVMVKTIICIRPTPDYIFDKNLFDKEIEKKQNKYIEEILNAEV